MAVDQNAINSADAAQRVAKENLFTAEDNLSILQDAVDAAQAALDEAVAARDEGQAVRDDAATTYGQQMGIYGAVVEQNGIEIPPIGGVPLAAERIKPLAK